MDPLDRPTKLSKQARQDDLKRVSLQIAEQIEGVERALPVADDFAIRVWLEGQERAALVQLGNVFRETLDLEPAARHEALDAFLRKMIGSQLETRDLASWTDNATRLRSVLRAVEIALVVPDETALVYRLVAPCLAEVLVLDFDTTMRMVSRQELSAWQQSEDAVFARARSNLDAMEASLAPYGPEHDALHHVLLADDNYASSFVLCADLVAGVSEMLGGELAVAMPHRSLALVARADDHDAMIRLEEVARREHAASARSISPEAYVVRSGSLVPAPWQPGRPAYAQAVHARIQFRGRIHRHQTDSLKEKLEQRGDDTFVASFKAWEVDGEQFSCCAWREGVRTLLPETDFVMLIGGDEPDTWTMRLPWPPFLELAGHLLERSALAGPARYLTRAWPDDALLQRLRTHAV